MISKHSEKWNCGAWLRPSAKFVLLSIVLTSCGGGTPKGQVLARVGGDEITAAQLSTVTSGEADSAVNRPAEAAALNGLIDQTLLMRAARDQHLDRKPEVSRQLDAADRAVLAASYAQVILASSVKNTPPQAQIVGYYQKRPDLFARRRILIVTELGVQKGLMTPDIKRSLAGRSDPDQISAVLAGRGINVVPTVRILSPEQLTGPAAALRAAHRDDRYTYFAAGLFVFGRIDDERDTPLTLNQAREAIIAAIQDETSQARLKAVIASLRASTPVVLGALGKSIIAEGGPANR